MILIATGSEVSLALEAHRQLADEGIRSRVVSMPCWELFDEQPQTYRDTVLPPTVRARVSIEAAAPFGWERYVGLEGAIIGVADFGASAPGAGRDARVRLHAGARRRDCEKNSWNEPMMIKNILCAIDRSPSSLQAFGYAIALAKWQNARLSLLEVIEEAPPPGVARAPKRRRCAERNPDGPRARSKAGSDSQTRV